MRNVFVYFLYYPQLVHFLDGKEVIKVKEIWKEIKDYEGLYWISNVGRVKSSKQMLKPLINKHGYYVVALYKDKKRKTALIHRLVAEAFIPNPDNLPQVNHIDEVKVNNRRK